MGCLCSKGLPANDYVANHVREKELNKSFKKFRASSTREEVAAEESNGGHDSTGHLIPKRSSGEIAESTPISWNDGEKAVAIKKPIEPQLAKPTVEGAMEVGVSGRQPQLSRIVSFSNGVQGAQVAAGWPSWLTAVAGEAIKGWLPRKADSFEKLGKIGQGTYSSVYKGRDLESGKIVAMKKVRFVNMDPESVRFMAREILILRRLDHPNVMKLEGLIASRVSVSLYLIFEYMEHDLAGLAAAPGVKFTEPQIKCYMQQLLCGLEHCHSRGVLHRDIKGSNLLIDNNGNLKIADFGLATFFRANQKQPLTSRVVTLWYRPPELLLGATDYGVSVDLWSTGCILAELYYGKPIMPGRTEVEQLHKIFKLCGSPSEEYWKKSKLPHATIFKPQNPYRRCVAETFKDFPSPALTLLDVLLAIEPESRESASSALQSEFFRTEPLPCSPSSLPKYPPSKEFDAKLRDEEARRKKAAAGKERGNEPARKGSRESKAFPAPDANAELQASIQKRQGQINTKSASEKYNPEEDSGSGFPIEPSRGSLQTGFTHSGHSNAFEPSHEANVNEDESLMGRHQALVCPRHDKPQGATELSRFSSSVAARGSSRETNALNSHWGLKGHGYNQLDGVESSRKHGWFHNLLDGPKSTHRNDERPTGKQSTTGYGSKNKRIHYSGPLLPPDGNLEEMLKEHERQIQNAVRKARFDKAKALKTYSDNGHAESLPRHGKSGK